MSLWRSLFRGSSSSTAPVVASSPAPLPVGTVAALWRYPVKSMLGERLTSAAFAARGLVGDRLLALHDSEGKLGSGKTTRRFRRIDGLFAFRARYDAAGMAVVTLPDGREMREDEPAIHQALTRALGVDVSLAREGRVWHMDGAPVHLLTTASLAWLQRALPASAIDARRFRPNLVVAVPGEAAVEQQWLGRVLRIGDRLRLKIGWATERCAMITLPQEELGADPAVSRVLAQINEHCLGVYAHVLKPALVQLGDPVALEGEADLDAVSRLTAPARRR